MGPDGSRGAVPADSPQTRRTVTPAGSYRGRWRILYPGDEGRPAATAFASTAGSLYSPIRGRAREGFAGRSARPRCRCRCEAPRRAPSSTPAWSTRGPREAAEGAARGHAPGRTLTVVANRLIRVRKGATSAWAGSAAQSVGQGEERPRGVTGVDRAGEKAVMSPASGRPSNQAGSIVAARGAVCRGAGDRHGEGSPSSPARQARGSRDRAAPSASRPLPDRSRSAETFGIDPDEPAGVEHAGGPAPVRPTGGREPGRGAGNGACVTGPARTDRRVQGRRPGPGPSRSTATAPSGGSRPPSVSAPTRGRWARRPSSRGSVMYH